jgi:hypothetical protein
MLLSKKEKEKLVIKLANEGKTTREIESIGPFSYWNHNNTKLNISRANIISFC